MFWDNNFFISSSLPDNLVVLFLLPFTLPMCFPSAFNLSNEFLVRWEIRFLSISDDSPKAKANI